MSINVSVLPSEDDQAPSIVQHKWSVGFTFVLFHYKFNGWQCHDFPSVLRLLWTYSLPLKSRRPFENWQWPNVSLHCPSAQRGWHANWILRPTLFVRAREHILPLSLVVEAVIVINVSFLYYDWSVDIDTFTALSIHLPILGIVERHIWVTDEKLHMLITNQLGIVKSSVICEWTLRWAESPPNNTFNRYYWLFKTNNE